jgi:hypothetical protein
LHQDWKVPEVFVEHSLKQSNIVLNYVLWQQQKLGTKFAIVAVLCGSLHLSPQKDAKPKVLRLFTF